MFSSRTGGIISGVVNALRQRKTLANRPHSTATQRLFEAERHEDERMRLLRALELERDPPLTEREWRQIEVARGSYSRRLRQ